MTDKQWKFIKEICETLDIDYRKCKGFTKQEASEFISAHIDSYRLVQYLSMEYEARAIEHGYF